MMILHIVHAVERRRKLIMGMAQSHVITVDFILEWLNARMRRTDVKELEFNGGTRLM